MQISPSLSSLKKEIATWTLFSGHDDVIQKPLASPSRDVLPNNCSRPKLHIFKNQNKTFHILVSLNSSLALSPGKLRPDMH